MNKPVVCVVGCDGNMGRRYIACLRTMDVDITGYDVRNSLHRDKIPTHYIVATPTETHVDALYQIRSRHLGTDHKPSILCEKPICFPREHCNPKDIFDDFGRVGMPFYMVCNYAYYPFLEGMTGATLYDYYNSGNDGLAWDCIQLLALAQDEVMLSNRSPIWRVQINGTPLSRNLIDETYLDMLYDFIFGARESKLWGKDETIRAHEKVLAYLGRSNGKP